MLTLAPRLQTVKQLSADVLSLCMTDASALAHVKDVARNRQVLSLIVFCCYEEPFLS